MNWEAVGAVGELVGGLAVVLTLVYIAFQVRQSRTQLDQNTRALEASTYYAVGDGFIKWWSLVSQDEALASLWQRGIAAESLNSADKLRFHSMAMILFTTLENNVHQNQLGSINRNTLEIAKGSWERILKSPGGKDWWKIQGRNSFTPEFIEAIESLIDVADPED